MIRCLVAFIILPVFLGCIPACAEIIKIDEIEALNWIRYTVPLPKSIEITAKIQVPKDQVRIVFEGSKDRLVDFAISELQKTTGIPQNTEQDKETLCTFRLQIGGPDAAPLKDLNNSDQAYRIFSPSEDGREVRLVANSSLGLYYAGKTLQQLIAAKSSGKSVTIPILEIIDWPDMEDRGIWGVDSHIRLKWMADRKMNLVEQISYLNVKSDGRGEASLKSGRETMITKAPLYGIKPVPAILHLDQVGGKGLFAAYPELRGQGGEENAICYSKPEGIITVLSDWMVDLVKLEHVDEVDTWLSENLHGKGGCKCDECKKEDRSVKEARVVLEAWKRAQQRVGKFNLRILTSEETGKSNALIMKELPEGVKLWYYHSLFTYTSGRSPMIPSEVSDYTAKGRWAGVVPSLCAWVNYPEPFTGAHFVHYRMNEFVDRKLSGLLAYPSPGINYTRFNTEAAAEWSWNAKGRSPREFALSYAVRQGMPDPEKFAEWSETMGPVAWDIYGSEWPACEKRQHPGQVAKLLKEGNLPELGSVKWNAFRGPWGDIKTPEQLNKDVENAAKGLKLAEEMRNPEILHESLAVDGYIKALKALYELKQIVKPDGIADGNKEAAAGYFRMYIDGMKQAAAALPAWEKTAAPQSKDGSLFVNASLKLVNRSIDQMQKLAGELGLSL